MSGPVEIKISGLDKIQQMLEQEIPKRAASAMRGSLRAGAQIIQAEIVRDAPKDTGLLSEHIDVKTRVRGKALSGSAFIGPNAKAAYPATAGKYGKKSRSKPARLIAKFLEFGTHKMPANPFMTRAFEATKSKATDALIAKLKATLGL